MAESPWPVHGANGINAAGTHQFHAFQKAAGELFPQARIAETELKAQNPFSGVVHGKIFGMFRKIIFFLLELQRLRIISFFRRNIKEKRMALVTAQRQKSLAARISFILQSIADVQTVPQEKHGRCRKFVIVASDQGAFFIGGLLLVGFEIQLQIFMFRHQLVAVSGKPADSELIFKERIHGIQDAPFIPAAQNKSVSFQLHGRLLRGKRGIAFEDNVAFGSISLRKIGTGTFLQIALKLLHGQKLHRCGMIRSLNCIIGLSVFRQFHRRGGKGQGNSGQEKKDNCFHDLFFFQCSVGFRGNIGHVFVDLLIQA